MEFSNYVELSCSVCGKIFQKPKAEYNRRLRLGKTDFACSLSCGAVLSNKNFPRPGNSKNISPGSEVDIYSSFRWFTARIRARTRLKGFSDIDEVYLKILWEQQEGLCPLSGKRIFLPRTTQGFEDNRSPYNASLDRIDSNLGYIKGNVRFVSFIANCAKAGWEDQVVLEFCNAVYKTHPESLK